LEEEKVFAQDHVKANQKLLEFYPGNFFYERQLFAWMAEVDVITVKIKKETSYQQPLVNQLKDLQNQRNSLKVQYDAVPCRNPI
jgi:hypothetical protein